MNVHEAIEQRYSVRSYQDKPIEQDKLERVLNAARTAPSASNRQDWKFVVVRDAEVKKALAEAAGKQMFVQAAVVVAAVATNPTRKMPCQVEAGTIDCAIAVDHMTLAAVEEGLGTCWIGAFDQAKCCKVLGVPDTARIIELLPIGYSAAERKDKSRKTMAEVICYDKFE